MKTGILWLTSFLCFWWQANAQLLGVDQLKEDFSLIQAALKEVHPDLFRFASAERLDSAFAAAAAQLAQPMTRGEFYRAMLPLLAHLRDGHIKWIVAGQDQHYPFHTQQLFPLKLYFVGTRAWIAGTYGQDQLPLGAEVVKINDKPIDAIVEHLLPRILFADGYTINGKYHELNNFFSGHYATHFGAHEHFTVSYKQDGEEKEATVQAVPLASIQANAQSVHHQPQSPYQFAFLKEKVGLLSLGSFSGNKKDYKAFLKNTFRQLKEQNAQQLILDLRNNEGGNESFGMMLYAYLAKAPFLYYDHIQVNAVKKTSFPVYYRPKHYQILRKLLVRKTEKGHMVKGLPGLKIMRPERDAFDGDLYVLTNGSSYSVSCEFAARAHADQRAIIIGQEAAGSYEGNNSGLFTIVRLPHAQIDLGIPMMGFYMADLPASLASGQGIVPHHALIPGIEDILHERDVEMAFVLQLIHEKQISSAGSTLQEKGS